MSNKQLRQTVRLLHVISSFILGTFIYGPWGAGSVLEGLVQFLAFPALAVTGLILWQQPRLARLRRGQNS
jgi:hypothetical protein